MKRYIIDIETDGIDPVNHIWSVVVRCANTGTILSSTGEEQHAKSFALIAEADELIGHNIIGFDLPVLAKFGCGWSSDCVITDTLVCSRVVWPDLRNDDFKRGSDFPKDIVGSHSLKAWGVRLGMLKNAFGESTDWTYWSPAMQTYCEQDTAVTQALLESIKKMNFPRKVFDLENKVASICRSMEKTGWKFDSAAADVLASELLCRKHELHQSLVATFPPEIVKLKTKTKSIPFNPGSRHDIARCLSQMYGWKPKELTPTGQPRIDDQILGELDYPEAKLLCDYLLIVKRLGQLSEGEEAWMKLVRNGRIHGRINTNGAVTGRATHSKPNMSQVPASRSVYGKECRSLFVPSEGKVMVGADASGLELRCLAHFLARYDDGAYGAVVIDGDVHWENAQAFGLVKKGTPRDKHNPDLEAHRNTSKSAIYAMIYGAGDTKLGEVVGGNESRGAALRKSFEKNVPAYRLLKEAVQERSKQGYLSGLDGRALPIRSQHAALNTLLQSAGALVMKSALCILVETLDKQGLEWGDDYAIVGWIHDEFQIECRPEIADLCGNVAVGSIKDAGKGYGFRVPLDGEFRTGRSWSETH